MRKMLDSKMCNVPTIFFLEGLCFHVTGVLGVRRAVPPQPFAISQNKGNVTTVVEVSGLTMQIILER